MNQYMNTAVELARAAFGQTGKNPPVGAVVVKAGKVIGTGMHLKYGGPHAEVNALNSCTESPEGASVYISLEPCSHHGNTPPCVDALIKAGVSDVYYAFKDTTLDTDGAEKFRAAGINYTHLEHPGASELYRPFVVSKKSSRPFVTLKCAMSIDGKIALSNGMSSWVSNESSRQDVHHLRGTHDAVLIGGGTLLADNPSLTTRYGGDSHARPVILAGSRTLDSGMNLFNHPLRPVIFTNEKDNMKFSDRCDVYCGTFEMTEVLEILYEKGIASVLIEGGTHILSQCINQQLFDDLIIYFAPKVFGYSRYQLYDKEVHDVNELALVLHDVERLDSDIKLIYRRKAECLQD